MKHFFGKKQVMIATLAVALGLAVYLNYYFAKQEPAPKAKSGTGDTATTATTAGDHLGDSQYVNSPAADPTEAEEVSAPTKAELPYFREARANRESARKEALEMLQELADDVRSSQSVIDEATAKIVGVAQAVEQESKIESLVVAKGFPDCVAYIEGDHCNIVVQAEGLTPAQSLQITEIITAQSDISGANIKISAVNS